MHHIKYPHNQRICRYPPYWTERAAMSRKVEQMKVPELSAMWEALEDGPINAIRRFKRILWRYEEGKY